MKRVKKLLSLLLTVVMVLSTMPADRTAYAASYQPVGDESALEVEGSGELPQSSDTAGTETLASETEEAVPVTGLVVNATQSDTYDFSTNPYVSGFDEALRAFHVLWNTNFVPLKIEVGEKIGENYTTLAIIESARYDYYFPAHDGLTEGYVRAYYGDGSSDYIYYFFDISMDPVKFTTKPYINSFDETLRGFHVLWNTSFVPLKIEVGEKISGKYTTLETIEAARYDYYFPAHNGLTEGYVRA